MAIHKIVPEEDDGPSKPVLGFGEVTGVTSSKILIAEDELLSCCLLSVSSGLSMCCEAVSGTGVAGWTTVLTAWSEDSACWSGVLAISEVDGPSISGDFGVSTFLAGVDVRFGLFLWRILIAALRPLKSSSALDSSEITCSADLTDLKWIRLDGFGLNGLLGLKSTGYSSTSAKVIRLD